MVVVVVCLEMCVVALYPGILASESNGTRRLRRPDESEVGANLPTYLAWSACNQNIVEKKELWYR